MKILADSITSLSECNVPLKKTAISGLLILLLPGCWASALKPDAAQLERVLTVLVVPIESPPLEVIPDLLEQRAPAYSHFRNMALGFPLPSRLYRTVGGVTIAGLVGDDEIADGSVQEAKPAQLDSDWSPAKVAAQKALKLLADERVKAVLSHDYYRLPWAEGNSHPQRWHEAVQAWYALDWSPVDYAPSGRFDAVLEVGIGGYRIFEGQTSLQLLMKLINPVSHRVLARTRVESFNVDDAALNSLNRDGEAFKQLIAAMSVPLVRQGLGEVGLRLPAPTTD